MLDAIESGGMEFIRSLGEEWRPLLQILQSMTLNERRSFCCKILYQRMKEMRLEEVQKSVSTPKPFIRETIPLTPEQQAELTENENWEEHLPKNVRDAYMAPRKLQAPYNITVAQLQIRGYYLPPVDFMADFCLRAAYHFGLPATGPVPLPRRTERWTVIKSPFIFKKQQENFERRTYSRLVTIKDGHPDVVEMWLSYCVRNMFHGTGMKVNMFTNDYIGVGKTMSEDIKQLIETDRWAVDGYNQLGDDAFGLQKTIDQEIQRIESQIAQRDDTERARRILRLRVDELLKLEGQAEKEARQSTMRDFTKALAAPSTKQEDAEDAAELQNAQISERRREALHSLVQRLPELQDEDLAKEVEWDKQQDEALRKHLLHVGKYAQQKGIAPLTREEYFVYVPHVLLPKYKGIHKDVFEALEELDLLRIPTGNTGYLADWDNMTERQRYDIVMQHRKPDSQRHSRVQKSKIDTSRLSRILEKRRNRQKTSIMSSDSETQEQESAADAAMESAEGEVLQANEVEETRAPEEEAAKAEVTSQEAETSAPEGVSETEVTGEKAETETDKSEAPSKS